MIGFGVDEWKQSLMKRELLLRLRKATYLHNESEQKKSYWDVGNHRRTAVAILMGLRQYIFHGSVKETLLFSQ